MNWIQINQGRHTVEVEYRSGRVPWLLINNGDVRYQVLEGRNNTDGRLITSGNFELALIGDTKNNLAWPQGTSNWNYFTIHFDGSKQGTKISIGPAGARIVS